MNTEDMFKRYRALGRDRDVFSLVYGESGGDGRKLEFYPPWESRNPTPGKATVEVYDKYLSPEDTERLVVAEVLHYLGAVDPRTGKPVDPTMRGLKQQFKSSITPEQSEVDRRAYERAKVEEYERRPYDDWFDVHRLDQYLGAPYLPIGSADRQDWMTGMTSEQKRILDLIDKYMERGSIAPGMNR